ncbi:hypothetical protein FIV00_26640 [Labrenzia sp. THAF82]|uniref:ribbon-helix-helix protein n=1 Tax=Labrenzia sp. THAF82 TaxID=2587861 RepID=UPI001267929B|nr:hypothetical protein [Labrenzia sp. THAF82]QFT34102.1 hypothetical protein FIV00_26640 [Labrenzia sp. THAF82]
MKSRTFASRPRDTDSWIKAADKKDRTQHSDGFTERLTIDVTPDQRARIKIAAFEHGMTVADMLRDLLAREFPPSEGST